MQIWIMSNKLKIIAVQTTFIEPITTCETCGGAGWVSVDRKKMILCPDCQRKKEKINKMWGDEEVPNLRCGECKYFLVNADLEWVKSCCKRIDHKTIKFAVPWFKSYDCNQFAGCICSDFLPAEWCVNIYNNWTGFEKYWEKYVELWLPYQNTQKTTSFTLNSDTSIRYHVPLLKFVYGNMIQGNTLLAIEKTYFKRDKSPEGFGYKLIHESIDGIVINLEKDSSNGN